MDFMYLCHNLHALTFRDHPVGTNNDSSDSTGNGISTNLLLGSTNGDKQASAVKRYCYVCIALLL